MKYSVLLSFLLFVFLSAGFIIGCAGTTQPVQITTTIQKTTAPPATTASIVTSPQATTTTIISTVAISNEPADFAVSGLHIEPEVVAADDYFSMIFTVNNTGGSNGIYDATIDIFQIVGENRIVLGTVTKSVMVAAGESEIVTFEEMHLPEGDYEAVIDRLSLLFYCT